VGEGTEVVSGQHNSAEWARNHAAGQRNIVNYCDCGMAPRGNVAWWSHTNAHPDHKRVSVTTFLALEQAREAGCLGRAEKKDTDHG
jgi:hypothetical protein